MFSLSPGSLPEGFGILAAGWYHVARAQKRGVAVAHLQLQLREIPEHGGMVRSEGVAAHIRYPVAEPGGTAQGLPSALPVARDVAVALADAPHATQGDSTPAARLAGAGAYDDMTLGPVDIPIFEAAHLGGADAAEANSPRVSIASKVRRAASVSDTPVPANSVCEIRFFFMVQNASILMNADASLKFAKDYNLVELD